MYLLLALSDLYIGSIVRPATASLIGMKLAYA